MGNPVDFTGWNTAETAYLDNRLGQLFLSGTDANLQQHFYAQSKNWKARMYDSIPSESGKNNALMVEKGFRNTWFHYRRTDNT